METVELSMKYFQQNKWITYAMNNKTWNNEILWLLGIIIIIITIIRGYR